MRTRFPSTLVLAGFVSCAAAQEVAPIADGPLVCFTVARGEGRFRENVHFVANVDGQAVPRAFFRSRDNASAYNTEPTAMSTATIEPSPRSRGRKRTECSVSNTAGRLTSSIATAMSRLIWYALMFSSDTFMRYVATPIVTM